ncbi:hypothetical protein ASC87_27240 [Rhizobacter sp. Root1221]|nr:hypothetical protein ASC87_27240 [Rhizobacter sp. Root1221]
MDSSLNYRRLDKSRGPWSLDETWRALHLYGPLLYLVGRHADARRMMECGLHPWFDGSRRRHRDLFLYIGNDDLLPTRRQRVTLSHIYLALGKSLASWEHWQAFVRLVPVEVMRRSSLSRRELRENPDRVAQLRN